MESAFSRTEMLLGAETMERLRQSRVAIFGLGGVGGYVLEALARSGVGQLVLIDNDEVSLSNLNRQILATRESIGRLKTDVAAERVRSINPDCRVETHALFYLPETRNEVSFTGLDYVVDAIDTVSGKLTIITEARAAGVPLICSLGTGNKLDPSRLRISDLYETQMDPLARIMRKECRKRGIDRLQVLWSDETPIVPDHHLAIQAIAEGGSTRRSIPGSSAFVPAAGGLLIASRVIRDLIGR